MGFWDKVGSYLYRQPNDIGDANGALVRNGSNVANGVATTSDPEFILKLLGQNLKGNSYSPNQLEGLPAVFAVIRLLSEDLGSIPFDVLSKSDDRRQMTGLPAYNIITEKPAYLQNKSGFWTSFWKNALQGGSGYAQIIRDDFFVPNRLRLWKWHEVGVYYDYLREEIEFTTPLGVVPFEDMIYVPLNSTDGIFGRTQLEVCAAAASEGLAAQEHGNSFYSNGAFPMGVLKTPNRLSNMPGADGNNEEQKAKGARDRLRSNFEGVAQTGKVAILEEGVTFETLNMKMGDIQFIETRKFGFTQVCSIYGVPPGLVQDYSDVKYSSAEQMELAYVKHTLAPKINLLEEELKTKLISPKYWGKCEVYGDMDALLRGDINTQTNHYTQMNNIGVLTSNDILRLKKRPTYEGGDERWRTAGSMPEATAKEYYKKEVGADKAITEKKTASDGK